jgi:hypothetical protein
MMHYTRKIHRRQTQAKKEYGGVLSRGQDGWGITWMREGGLKVLRRTGINQKRVHGKLRATGRGFAGGNLPNTTRSQYIVGITCQREQAREKKSKETGDQKTLN